MHHRELADIQESTTVGSGSRSVLTWVLSWPRATKESSQVRSFPIDVHSFAAIFAHLLEE